MSKNRGELSEVMECKNVIHPTCCKKLMTTFGEDQWEGPLFCGKRCFMHQNKALNSAASKAKGRVSWHNDGLTPEINFIAVMIDWMQLATNKIDAQL